MSTLDTRREPRTERGGWNASQASPRWTVITAVTFAETASDHLTSSEITGTEQARSAPDNPPDSLGRDVGDAYIRTHNKDVAEPFEHAPRGTPVTVVA